LENSEGFTHGGNGADERLISDIGGLFPMEAGNEIRGLKVFGSLAAVDEPMDRCPKIELFRPFWKSKLGQEI
jgi:hypothetical protein